MQYSTNSYFSAAISIALKSGDLASPVMACPIMSRLIQNGYVLADKHGEVIKQVTLYQIRQELSLAEFATSQRNRKKKQNINGARFLSNRARKLRLIFLFLVFTGLLALYRLITFSVEMKLAAVTEASYMAGDYDRLARNLLTADSINKSAVSSMSLGDLQRQMEKSGLKECQNASYNNMKEALRQLEVAKRLHELNGNESIIKEAIENSQNYFRRGLEGASECLGVNLVRFL